MSTEMRPPSDHFRGKEVIQHVIEKQAEGVVSKVESHGTEMPGHLSAGADTAKEMGAIFLILAALLPVLLGTKLVATKMLFVFGLAWVVWRAGRCALLGWARLERLHRLVSEEKWEIQHHREQEKAELKELYRAKGLEGKLLDDVIDVLMADEQRLLQVMLEEELGLVLEVHEHPLKQGFGALIGGLLSLAFIMGFVLILPAYGLVVGSLSVIGISIALAAQAEKNRIIPAIVWNVGLGALVYGFSIFLFDFIHPIR